MLWAVEEEERQEAERKQQEEEEKQRRAEAALEVEWELREQGGGWMSRWRSSGSTNRGRRSGKSWTWKTRGHALAASQGR